MGGALPTEFIGGTGTTSMVGGSMNDTFVGGSGHDTMVAGSGSNVFEFLSSEAGGQHVIKHFVSGTDQLYLEGYSLSQLQMGTGGTITTSGHNTFITLDGGKTSIELVGVKTLNTGDVTTTKP